mmetsp:Transcript_25100/g.63086  ORF Transcript_25100/g.63086 Transcript_25100/m.63086 type:complete len:180 (+) Transcript_25100:264-803(+)
MSGQDEQPEVAILVGQDVIHLVARLRLIERDQSLELGLRETDWWPVASGNELRSLSNESASWICLARSQVNSTSLGVAVRWLGVGGLLHKVVAGAIDHQDAAVGHVWGPPCSAPSPGTPSSSSPRGSRCPPFALPWNISKESRPLSQPHLDEPTPQRTVRSPLPDRTTHWCGSMSSCHH